MPGMTGVAEDLPMILRHDTNSRDTIPIRPATNQVLCPGISRAFTSGLSNGLAGEYNWWHKIEYIRTQG